MSAVSVISMITRAESMPEAVIAWPTAAGKPGAWGRWLPRSIANVHRPAAGLRPGPETRTRAPTPLHHPSPGTPPSSSTALRPGLCRPRAVGASRASRGRTTHVSGPQGERHPSPRSASPDPPPSSRPSASPNSRQRNPPSTQRGRSHNSYGLAKRAGSHNGRTGARYWDRTSDLYRVKVALSR